MNVTCCQGLHPGEHFAYILRASGQGYGKEFLPKFVIYVKMKDQIRTWVDALYMGRSMKNQQYEQSTQYSHFFIYATKIKKKTDIGRTILDIDSIECERLKREKKLVYLFLIN